MYDYMNCKTSEGTVYFNDIEEVIKAIEAKMAK